MRGVVRNHLLEARVLVGREVRIAVSGEAFCQRVLTEDASPPQFSVGLSIHPGSALLTIDVQWSTEPGDDLDDGRIHDLQRRLEEIELSDLLPETLLSDLDHYEVRVVILSRVIADASVGWGALQRRRGRGRGWGWMQQGANHRP